MLTLRDAVEGLINTVRYAEQNASGPSKLACVDEKISDFPHGRGISVPRRKSRRNGGFYRPALSMQVLITNR